MSNKSHIREAQERGRYIPSYDWFLLLYDRNQQLSSSKKKGPYKGHIITLLLKYQALKNLNNL